jgi:hypothetical protein
MPSQTVRNSQRTGLKTTLRGSSSPETAEIGKPSVPTRVPSEAIRWPNTLDSASPGSVAWKTTWYWSSRGS